MHGARTRQKESRDQKAPTLLLQPWRRYLCLLIFNALSVVLGSPRGATQCYRNLHGTNERWNKIKQIAHLGACSCGFRKHRIHTTTGERGAQGGASGEGEEKRGGARGKGVGGGARRERTGRGGGEGPKSIQKEFTTHSKGMHKAVSACS